MAEPVDFGDGSAPEVSAWLAQLSFADLARSFWPPDSPAAAPRNPLRLLDPPPRHAAVAAIAPLDGCRCRAAQAAAQAGTVATTARRAKSGKSRASGPFAPGLPALSSIGLSSDPPASSALLNPSGAPRGKITVDHVWGAGSFGLVYLGTFKGQKATIEMAAPALDGQQQQVLSSCLDAMQTVCHHPAVSNFYAACIDDQGILFVSELCDLGALDLYLIDHCSLAAPPRVRLCADVANGMRHLETFGYVHGDLAGRNIRLHRRVLSGGQDVVVAKVADLGLSRRINAILGRCHLVANPITFRWAAPEVLADHTYTGAADVWSFGVVIWEIFASGMVPYGMYRDAATLRQELLDGRALLPRPQRCPEGVWAAYNWACALAPDARPTFAMLASQISAEL